MRTSRGNRDDASPSRKVWPSFARSALLLVLALVVVSAAQATEIANPTAEQLKAAFLYKFSRYVAWPEKALSRDGGPVVIGVVGDGPVWEALRSLTESPELGANLVVKRFAGPEVPEACHVLFVVDGPRRRLDAVLRGVAGTPTLTVGESNGFLESGGMINFVLVDSMLRFQIDLTAAENAGLGISSKLLKLALEVRGEPSSGGR